MTATTVHWETRLFSDPTATAAPTQTGRGWDAPTYAGIDDQLSDARSRLDRVSARAAYQEVLHGRAVLVDIRPAAQRAFEGEVAAHLGPIVIERNVLEWRLDPTSDARLPEAVDHDVHVVVLCRQGYSSSLAAARLQSLGLHRATDVIGGFEAWTAAGLPVFAIDPSRPVRSTG